MKPLNKEKINYFSFYNKRYLLRKIAAKCYTIIARIKKTAMSQNYVKMEDLNSFPIEGQAKLHK